MKRQTEYPIAEHSSYLFAIESLSWESDFFDLQTAKLHIKTPTEVSLDEAKTESWLPYNKLNLNDFALLQCKIAMSQTDHLDILNHLGFQLVEGEIDLAFDLRKQVDLSAQVKSQSTSLSILSNVESFSAVSFANESHISELRAVANDVFSASRFRSPWYKLTDSGKFYAEWIEKAVLGSFDHLCLIVLNRETRQMAGFVTLRKLNQNEARIGLLAAVASRDGLINKNKGVGKALINAAKQWCLHENISTLRIATQSSNLPALKRYISEGANIASSSYWLYKKIDKQINRGFYDPI